jgi:hypothetical protein
MRDEEPEQPVEGKNKVGITHLAHKYFTIPSSNKLNSMVILIIIMLKV